MAARKRGKEISGLARERLPPESPLVFLRAASEYHGDSGNISGTDGRQAPISGHLREGGERESRNEYQLPNYGPNGRRRSVTYEGRATGVVRQGLGPRETGAATRNMK